MQINVIDTEAGRQWHIHLSEIEACQVAIELTRFPAEKSGLPVSAVFLAASLADENDRLFTILKQHSQLLAALLLERKHLGNSKSTADFDAMTEAIVNKM